MVLVMLGGNGMYALAKSYSDSDDVWCVTNKKEVTGSKTKSTIKGKDLKDLDYYYAASATCYNKKGDNIAYKGAYRQGTYATATAKKAFKVKSGKIANWVCDDRKSRISDIWRH